MPSPTLSLLFLSLILHTLLSTSAFLHHHHHRIPNFQFNTPTTTTNSTLPTRYFEVTRPINLPNTKPCSSLILQHKFAYTYGKPPVIANYTPPSNCPSTRFAKIVLEWNATCKGTQYDRIFGVWLDGVEILRSCTAEPRATGIVWTVKKDITRYYSLLMKDGTLAVYLGNLVTRIYTGVYDVNLTFYYYPFEKSLGLGSGRDLKFGTLVPGFGESSSLDSGSDAKVGNFVPGFGSNADLVIPISRNLPLDDGLWFEIENSTDVEKKDFVIPQNAYRAVLEVYLSFHGDDEFWYANLPNEFIEANNLTGVDGNGPFREVVVSLDGDVIGGICPFTVVYTGGINPLLWRPITGIGSFDLPSYDIEFTPFLGKTLDGKVHELGFSVTNGLDVWYVDANLHVWLDDKSTKTKGALLSYENVPPLVSSLLEFSGLNGNFLIKASRSVSSSGWVESSYGNITTNSTQGFSFTNVMVIGDDGNLQIVNQSIHFNDSVDLSMPVLPLWSFASYKYFPLYLWTEDVDQGKGSYLSLVNISLVFEEKRYDAVGFLSFSCSFLNNVQEGQGSMLVRDNLVVSGLGSTQEVYKYNSSQLCYFRNVSSSDYTILYDHIGCDCPKDEQPRVGSNLGGRSYLA